ncbi:hypothetical protein M6B38_341130 [Iris pallida]|uniref:Uncharacterized protein n=1 Tax=Iris pallida TaxID=29817 RepID=A0AAX6GXX1_IRIPA|nr:hypothetical protein M6B38_341130 [Iris pallida]
MTSLRSTPSQPAIQYPITNPSRPRPSSQTKPNHRHLPASRRHTIVIITIRDCSPHPPARRPNSPRPSIVTTNTCHHRYLRHSTPHRQYYRRATSSAPH